MKHKLLLAFLTILNFPAVAQFFSYTHEGQTLNYVLYDEVAKTCGVFGVNNNISGDVIIPANVMYNGNLYTVTRISSDAFYGCNGLTSVIIPNSVISIGIRAFSNCRGLTSVIIPNSVKSIDQFAFTVCRSLTSVTIPNSVTSIGDGLFRYCSNLTEILVDVENPNYTSVDGVLFNKDITKIIAYPKGLTTSTYSIPNSVTSIGRDAFYDCSSLTSVTIPNSVTSIGEWAFSWCSGLTSITIPNSITNFGNSELSIRTFEGCTGLKEINYNTTTPIKNAMFFFGSDIYSTATLYVAVGGLEVAKQTMPWSMFKNIQEKDFTLMVKSIIVKLPGGTLHLAEEHAGTTVRLMADEGFEFHSASLDDADISYLVGEQGHFTVPTVEKPTVLNVVFKQTSDPDTEINAVSLDDEVRVTVHSKRVSITGKNADTEVRAYDLRGVLLEDTTDSDFYLDYSGVVILRIGADTFKFAI